MATNPKIIPPRLHVLLAAKSPKALIIRRGPSNRVATIGWDRKNNTFTTGQWLKGKLYPFRCDISPDGAYWIYFAKSEKTGQTYTAIAKPPYLKALDFYTKGDAWNGGGLFATTRSYWLNDEGTTHHEKQRTVSGLAVLSKWQNQPNHMGECPNIYFLKLARDGWAEQETTKISAHKYTTIFTKPYNDTWQLRKIFHSGQGHPKGKSPYYESHALYNTKTKAQQDFPGMEWADIDNNRLLWAENGKIITARVSASGLTTPKILFDTTHMEFEELIAPY